MSFCADDHEGPQSGAETGFNSAEGRQSGAESAAAGSSESAAAGTAESAAAGSSENAVDTMSVEELRRGDWTCPNSNCGINCFASRVTCFKCHTPKPAT